MHDIALHRAWSPPTNEKRRPGQVAAHLGNQKNGTSEYTAAAACAARVIEHARRRALHLDRLADQLLVLNMHEAAERLSHRAASIREVLA